MQFAQRRLFSAGRVFASPLAKKTVRESGHTLEQVASALNRSGSGPNNRILFTDVTKALSQLSSGAVSISERASHAGEPARQASVPAAPSAAGEYEFTIGESAFYLAEKYTQTKKMVPHYYLSVDLNVQNILKLRERLNASLGKTGTPISLVDILLKAAAGAMKHVPDVNAAWMDTFVRRYDQVHVNMLVRHDNRLSAPVISNIGGKGLATIAEELSRVESTAPDSDSFSIGTFSVHNLGMFGVKSAAPIVLSPQACALALGTVVDTVVPASKAAAEAGKTWEVAPILTATLSCDHRVVDGAVAAEWLAVFKRLVEQPEELLL